MKLHLIMPMGGAGSRFSKNGYVHPKPLIEIHGKPFFYWAAESILRYIEDYDLTFVILKQHIEQFNLDKKVKEFYPDARIEVLPEVLPGPVFTSLKGVSGIEDNLPILFNDCDHMFRCEAVNKLINSNELGSDGVLLTFKADTPQFSYIKYDTDGKIIGTVEKQVVSNHAICGAYIFRDAELFKEAAAKYINNCPYNECFMSGLYNVMCDEGLMVKDYLLDYHVEFGTPEEYEVAKDSPYFE